jgi:predicted Zn-dependent protease/transglutaminase-like putative cysteine protease
MRIFWPLCALCLALSNLPAAQPDYSKEAYVVEKQATDVEFWADGTDHWEQAAAVRLQSEAGVQRFGVLTFPYSREDQRIEVLYVRVRKPDGTVVETPEANVQDVSSEVARQAPTYSDLREKQIPVKGLGVGDVLEYSVRLVRTKSEVPGHFWYEGSFVKDAVVLEETLRITVPADKYVQVKSPSLKPELREESGGKIYLWKTAHLEPTAPEDPKKKASKTLELPDVRVTTFKSWEELGAWYGSLSRPRAAVTPAIQAKAAELTKGLTTADEKQRAIYKYVAGRFRYIGIEFGQGRYQPHSADDVLANQYGDCKDKHTLFAALLRAAGIESWPALIGAGIKFDPDFPSPSQFNHVISVLPQKRGEVVWLDTTPEVAPYGLLQPTIRHKQALAIPDDGPPALMTTPADPPFPAVQKYEAKATLDASGTLTGHLDFTYRGDIELLLRAAFHQTPPAQWQALAQRLSYAWGYGGTVSHLDVDNPEDTERPFHYSYDYLRKNYCDWENRRIMPPMPSLMLLYDQNGEKPAEPVELGSPGETAYHSTIRLPEGNSITLPPGAKLQSAFLDYSSSYSVADGVFSAERHMTQKKSKVPLDAWPEYVKLAKALNDDTTQFFQLAERHGAGAAVTADNNPEAEKLVRDGFQALQNRDLVAAKDLFARAEKLNPKQAELWRGYAVAYVLERQDDKALEALQKELRYHPDSINVYPAVAELQMRSGHSDDALETWRSLLKVAPKDTNAALQLWRLAMEKKRYSEAVEPLRASLMSAPDNPHVESMLGEMLLRSGKKDEGVAVLAKMGAHAPNWLILNNAAWALADTDADLELAREYGEKSVASLEDETKNIAIPTLTAQDLGLVYSQPSIWDTLGWVCFHQGDLAKAERYIRASWLLGQGTTEADHLGQVYERQGKRQEAIHAYRLALARDSRQDETRARLEKLGSVETPKGVPPAEELQRLRTTDIPGLTNRKGSAEFWVLFSANKVEDAQFVTGEDTFKNAREALMKAPFNAAFPDDGPEKIVRRGVLSCSAYTVPNCRLVLFLPADTKR